MAQSITLPQGFTLSNADKQSIANLARDMNQGQSAQAGTGAYRPSGTPSSTQLYNAGTTTPSGQPVNSFAQNARNAGIAPVALNQQGNISDPHVNPATGQWDDNYYARTHPSGGGPKGPGGIALGSYDSSKLSQDQRQWLFEQFGHKGTAPMGYGGENPNPPSTPPPPPVPKPLPMPVATFTQIPPSPTEAAKAPGAVGLPGAGMAGKASPISNITSKALFDLQSIPSVPSAMLNPVLPVPRRDIELRDAIRSEALQSELARSAATPQTPYQRYVPRDIRESIGPALQAAGLVTAVKDIGKGTIGVGSALARGEGLGQAFKSGTKGLFTGLSAPLGAAEMDMTKPTETEAAYKQQTRQFGQTTPEGQFKASTQPQGASYQNLSGNLSGDQAGQAIQAVALGQASIQDVASGIATNEAPSMVSKAINQAMKTGDMGAVGRLAELHSAVTKQLNFVNQIGQLVAAIAQGFGSPQGAELTGARMPLVETGIGQALTTMPQPDFSYQGTDAQSAQMLPYRPPEVGQVQRNKPIVYPFMGR